MDMELIVTSMRVGMAMENRSRQMKEHVSEDTAKKLDKAMRNMHEAMLAVKKEKLAYLQHLADCVREGKEVELDVYTYKALYWYIKDELGRMIEKSGHPEVSEIVRRTCKENIRKLQEYWSISASHGSCDVSRGRTSEDIVPHSYYPEMRKIVTFIHELKGRWL